MFGDLKNLPYLCTRLVKETLNERQKKFLRKVFLKFLKNNLEV